MIYTPTTLPESTREGSKLIKQAESASPSRHFVAKAEIGHREVVLL
jgi:hypothetical protein